LIRPAYQPLRQTALKKPFNMKTKKQKSKRFSRAATGRIEQAPEV
jgi:hypothetical protein